MNEEVLKIRKTLGYENKSRDYHRIEGKEIVDYIYELNKNMASLCRTNYKEEYDEEQFINIIIKNIYTILKMFSDMNVFPGYFFRKVFEMNDKYYERKRDYDAGNNSVRQNAGIRGDYKFFNETNLSAWVSKEIEKGLNNGYHHVEAYPKSNISDAFTEILMLFQKYNFPYKITTSEEYRKSIEDISINYSNISTSFLNSDYVEEDIEFMCRLLFDYISLFVSLGVNPKRYLDEYIEKQANIENEEDNEKHK